MAKSRGRIASTAKVTGEAPSMIDPKTRKLPSHFRNTVLPVEELGDFTTTWRVLPISGIAIVVGVVSAYVALFLLRLIGLCTNLFFYGRWRADLVSPAGHHLGYFVVLIPAIGGLLVGLMARFGSDRIRHGIPEAIEAEASVEVRPSSLDPRPMPN